MEQKKLETVEIEPGGLQFISGEKTLADMNVTGTWANDQPIMSAQDLITRFHQIVSQAKRRAKAKVARKARRRNRR
jgi:hypothetical protein